VAQARGEAASTEVRAQANANVARVEAEAAAAAQKMKADADATSIRMRGEAEALALRARGAAAADAHKAGVASLGEHSYTAVQLATILGEAKLKLVPDVAVGDGGSSGSRLTDGLIGRMLAGDVAGKGNGKAT